MLGIDPDRIVLVPPGIDPPGPVDPVVTARMCVRYGLDQRPFFLFPAITYPHKNHLTLVRAFAEVAAEDPAPLLVLTGGEAQAEEAVRSEVERRGLAERVVRTGRIPVADLDALCGRGRRTNVPVAL